jgi:hypothetical protein
MRHRAGQDCADEVAGPVMKRPRSALASGQILNVTAGAWMS